MTMATDDSRLSNLEGRIEEQSLGIQDLREGLRQTNADLVVGFREVNARFDRLFLAILGIGAAQLGLMIGLIITLILKT
jgi:hypothetical protein